MQKHKGTPADLTEYVYKNQEMLYRDFEDFARGRTSNAALAPAKILRQLDDLAQALEDSKGISDAQRGRSTRELQVYSTIVHHHECAEWPYVYAHACA